MLYVVKKMFVGDKKCYIDKFCATIHFFCFRSPCSAWNKCRGKMFCAFDQAKTQQLVIQPNVRQMLHIVFEKQSSFDWEAFACYGPGHT